jgi:endonuclease/exonuclease/phosphatase family metal-dependent hydrolase
VYDTSRQVWQHSAPLQQEKEEKEATTSLSEVKIVTYNVWFSEKHKEARAKALFSILEKEDADFINLQEVTPEFLQWLQKEVNTA